MTENGRNPWPQHVKSRALQIAAESSFVAAQAATGVPAATVRSWARRATIAAGVELVQDRRGVAVPWPKRAPILLEAFGHASLEAVEAVRNAIRRGKSQDARNYAVAAGISTEKALLLGGGATTRTEAYTVSATAQPRERPDYEAEIRELDADIARLRGELNEGANDDNPG